MKIKVDIDCTPAEARAFFGLPDVEPLQKSLLADMERRAKEGLKPEEIDALMRQWLSGAEQVSKMFFSAMSGKGRTGE
ncbi:MAG: DUF6489 family protein [Rhodothalassiaceae bacterium]